MTNDSTNHLAPLRRLTETDLCGWLGRAAPGEMLEYHRGFLALDSVAQTHRLPERQRLDLIRVARRAIWAAEHGFAHPVQRRHGTDDYSYLLIARPRPKGPSASLSTLLGAEAA